MDRPDSISILGVRVDRADVEYLLTFIDKMIKGNHKALISYINIHGLNLAYSNPRFRDYLNNTDLNFCDGFGVSIAAQLIGYGSLPRQTPPDWISTLAALCANRGYTMYFLGSNTGVAEKAALKLKEAAPDLKFVGTHHGFFDKKKGAMENNAVIDDINRRGTNILWVGFGMPLQEWWLQENWDSLDVNIALPCGALFDYLSGEIKRGPKWITDHGLEWLTRLFIEPGRLWRRYLVGNPLFFWRVFQERSRKN